MNNMILIVGLGNPGKKYEKTRHNVGFRAVDGFQEKNNFSAFKLSKKSLAEISEGSLGNEKVILAKPQTFMNNSGQAVRSLLAFYRITRPGLVIIHDDIDLPFGKIRISVGRSSAGHKGVESIIRELKTKGFVRFRIGIKPEPEKPSTRAKHGAGLVPYRNKVSGTGFVLEKFSKDEEKALKEVTEKTIEAVKMAVKEGVEKTMMKFN